MVGIVLLLIAPLVSKFMQKPKIAIICFALGLTVIIWVVAIAAIVSVNAEERRHLVSPEVNPVPSGSPGQSNSPQNLIESVPQTQSQQTRESPARQNVKVMDSPNSVVYQAGRDLVVNNQVRNEQIESIQVEARMTCTIKTGPEPPPESVEIGLWSGGDAYLRGSANSVTLKLASPIVYFAPDFGPYYSNQSLLFARGFTA